jgi:hypothetical protein
MTIAADRPRTEPIAPHAYTLPVVREVPIAGSLSASPEPHGSEQTPVYAADSHGW